MSTACPRTQTLDNALHTDSQSELPFKITKVVRAGDEKYSQVFYGILGDIEIELLDERYFPVPDINHSFHGEDWPWHPQECLGDFHTVEDMIRRELAVYEDSRLRELQGNQILHRYGAHHVRLGRVDDDVGVR